MKPLLLILKIFLLQRCLNEVFKGGLSSYSLSTMVAHFLLTHQSRHLDRKGGRSLLTTSTLNCSGLIDRLGCS